MFELNIINDEVYKLDNVSDTLFEDEYSFSFAKLLIKNRSFKFAWNSKGVIPEIKVIEECSVVFIGVDTYIVGINYSNFRIAFYLNTSTNFKWFSDIPNGISIVTENGIILVNTFNHCTIRNCVFFGDIIVDSEVEKGKMRISFLSQEDETIII